MLLLKGERKKARVISDIARGQSVLLFVIGEEHIYIPNSEINIKETFLYPTTQKPKNFSCNGTIEECITIFNEGFEDYNSIEDVTYDYIVVYTNQYDENNPEIMNFINMIRQRVNNYSIIILACK